jgi:hypothetical protein
MNVYGKILSVISVVALIISIYYIVEREIQVSGFNEKQEQIIKKLDSLQVQLSKYHDYVITSVGKDSSAIRDILQLAKKYTGEK